MVAVAGLLVTAMIVRALAEQALQELAWVQNIHHGDSD